MSGAFKIFPAARFSVACDGFSGVLYKNARKNSRQKALIILGGSSGGRISMLPIALYFCRRGFDSLILDYHGKKGLPGHLKDQPVETVGKAADRLKNDGYEKIGAYGLSMGTCIAVLAAVHFPELISCLVLVSPMYMVTQAERRNDSGVLDGSSFALNGEPVPYAEWNMSSLRFNIRYFTDCIKHRDLYCRGMLEQTYANSSEPRAILPVEKIRGSILFVSGSLDGMIPTNETCEIFMKTLDETHFPYPHRHINFDHLGHAIIPLDSPLLRVFRSERLYPREGQNEKRQAYREIVGFLKYEWQ